MKRELFLKLVIQIYYQNMWNSSFIRFNHKKLCISCFLFLFCVIIFILYLIIDKLQNDFLNRKEYIFIKNDKNVQVDTKLKNLVEYKEEYGAMGKPVSLLQNWMNKINKPIENCEEDYGYNKCVSDLISLNRTLPDFRNEKCMALYDNDDDLYPFDNDFQDFPLPSVSAIVIFYNEAWTTLLRTIHSLINRSPQQLLREIILVDDGSTEVHLKRQLNTYLKRALYKKVRLLRTHRRLGAMGARVFGAEKSIGEVLIFLDPCCEFTDGWLGPLLQRIIISPKKIVIPVIDKINKTTFEYQPQDLSNLYVSGFNWNLQHIPLKVIAKKDIVTPFVIPIISHGIFAIFSDYFFRIINYGDDIIPWLFSPEISDLEISFKSWMCGGEIEIVPCSRIGYTYRKKIFSSVTQEGEEKSLREQKSHIAEIWMDEFKNHYYQQMGTGFVKIGDIYKRKIQKKKLKCKSFRWYLSNIYPQLKPIESNFTGELTYLKKNGTLCLESQMDLKSLYQTIQLSPCHGKGGNQFWIYSKEGRIRQDGVCLASDNETNIKLVTCGDHSDNQFWAYNHNSKQIYHESSSKCLIVMQEDLALENCTFCNSQTWSFNEYKNTIIY